MAITCSWKNPLGRAKTQWGQEVTFYGGGNGLCCIVYDSKNLENFIIDKKHFKDCEYTGKEYTDIDVFGDRKAEAKKLIECLMIAGFEFRYYPTSKGRYDEEGNRLWG